METKIPTKEISTICDRMAQLVEEAVGLKPETPWLKKIVTNHSIRKKEIKADKFTFSGGVADCIYYPENYIPGQFGDIGVELGRAIRKTAFFDGALTIRPQETIRATVVGAGNHSMELSGSTITYTEDDFPLRDIPIVKLKLENMDDLVTLPENMKKQISIYQSGNGKQEFAIAFSGISNPSFIEIEKITETLCKGYDEEIQKGSRLIIIIEADIAKAVGLSLKRKVNGKCKIICIDSIHAEEGDYIDIGKPMTAGRVLPVVVKTLIFI